MDLPIRRTLMAAAFFLSFAPLLAWSQGVESDGIGVEDLAPQMADKKKESGWLGVLLEKPDADTGVDVAQVLRGSPAEKAGLQKGDRILRVDKNEVGSPSEVQKVVGKKAPGQKARVELRRQEKTYTVAVELASAPSTEQILKNQFVGHAAPGFSAEVVGQKDTTVELAKLKGKPVVIDFWATWCGPCRPMSKKLGKLREKTGEQVHFVGLTSESKETVERYLATHPHGFQVATTTEAVMQTYLVESYPTVFVLDAKGKVAGIFVGLGKMAEIDELVEKLAKDQ